MLPSNNQSVFQIGQVKIYANINTSTHFALLSFEETFYKLEEYVEHYKSTEIIISMAHDCKAAVKRLIMAAKNNQHDDIFLIAILESINVIYDIYIKIETYVKDIIDIRRDFADLGIYFIKQAFHTAVSPQTLFNILSYEWALKNNILSRPYVYPHSFGGNTEEQTYIFTDAEIERFFEKYNSRAVIAANNIRDGQTPFDFYTAITRKVIDSYRKFSNEMNNDIILLVERS